MGKLKKIWNVSLPDLWVSIVMIVLLGGGLLPLFRLAMYAVPAADDYSYGEYVKDFLETNGVSFQNAFCAALQVVRNTYDTWQGTYSSIFFMSLVPCVFGEAYYYIGIAALLAFFTVAACIFGNTVLKYTLSATGHVRISIPGLKQ